MRRPDFIARQARCPSGWLGWFLVRIMARETASENAEAIGLLDIQSSDQVLEVGFGHGRSLLAIAATLSEGCAVGVDVSDDMVRQLARRYHHLIAAGRLQVHCADSRQLPLADAQFDKVLAIHTIYFWNDPLVDLREIARVVKPGGRLVLGFRPRSDSRAVADLPASVYRFYDVDEVQHMLEQADFNVIHPITRSRNRGTLFAVGARRGSP